MPEHHAVIRYKSPVDVYQPTDQNRLEFVALEFDAFGIDDSRRLIDEAYRTPVGEAESKLISVALTKITVEAQQALLKLLEEPPSTTRFVFTVPEGCQLLPTVLSRFSIRIEEEKEDKKTVVFDDFLASNYAERLEIIEKELKAKNTDWQTSMQQGLIEYLNQHKAGLEHLHELEFISRYYLKRGSSNKMLLEHLALVTPTRR